MLYTVISKSFRHVELCPYFDIEIFFEHKKIIKILLYFNMSAFNTKIYVLILNSKNNYYIKIVKKLH